MREIQNDKRLVIGFHVQVRRSRVTNGFIHGFCENTGAFEDEAGDGEAAGEFDGPRVERIGDNAVRAASENHVLDSGLH